ncbi:serine/threonine kinase [Aureococcus anophagefferens]|nr:serine/threonine kinase [Aureococcus anophagefferens]
MASAKKQVGKYEIGRTLGEGTFGKVKHAVNVETQEAVAIKVLDKERIQKQSMGSQIKKEISIMKQLEHANVVKLNEVLASRTKIFIVLELVTGGELFDRIVTSGKLNEHDARFYFKQLVGGVAYCHSQGVAHRDLKPENLLLDEQGCLKISDFGLSALYDGEDGASRSQMLHTTCGTPNYVAPRGRKRVMQRRFNVAPEVLMNEGYDGRIADCWSIGVILYVLLAGFLPFDEGTMHALFQKIKDADYAYPDFFTKPVTELVDTILVADPKARATLNDVQKNAWFCAADAGPPPAVEPAPDAASPLKEKQSTRVSCFASSRDPPALFEALKTALDAAGAQLASLKSPKGLISLLGKVRRDGDKTALEILRGKGDILAYNAFETALLAHLGDAVDAP